MKTRQLGRSVAIARRNGPLIPMPYCIVNNRDYLETYRKDLLTDFSPVPESVSREWRQILRMITVVIKFYTSWKR